MDWLRTRGTELPGAGNLLIAGAEQVTTALRLLHEVSLTATPTVATAMNACRERARETRDYLHLRKRRMTAMLFPKRGRPLWFVRNLVTDLLLEPDPALDLESVTRLLNHFAAISDLACQATDELIGRQVIGDRYVRQMTNLLGQVAATVPAALAEVTADAAREVLQARARLATLEQLAREAQAKVYAESDPLRIIRTNTLYRHLARIADEMRGAVDEVIALKRITAEVAVAAPEAAAAPALGAAVSPPAKS